MRRAGNLYQYSLIALGLAASGLFGVFLAREMFPEYLIYQHDFIALENFRAEYTKEPAAPFKAAVKQIVIEREDKGPPVIDRCTSCHVALQIEDYSPTRIARDLNGNIIYDKAGVPGKEENPNYIWKKVDEAIAANVDPAQTKQLEALKIAEVGEFTYDVSKVLVMHPLIGRETRPFEFHPLEDYGCVSCHGGNGRGLVTDRAHGPVFDGQYEKESVGFVPEFLEKDPLNDPSFSKVFNAKPGPRLLFQTNPLYVGALIQAKCMQCHQSTQEVIEGAKDAAGNALKQKKSTLSSVEKSYILEKTRIEALLGLNQSLKKNGLEKTLAQIETSANDYTLPQEKLDAYKAQSKFFRGKSLETIQKEISNELIAALGSEKIIAAFETSANFEKTLDETKETSGTLFEKRAYYNYTQELMKHISDVSAPLGENIASDELAIGQIQTDVDLLTQDYKRGKSLFISQGCYACHRISGYARGGVGPELTRSGESYPWFVKESITWPQADLKTSTMPNLKLDHEELEALVTYLLAQTGKSKSISETARKIALQEWELGKKQPWERPLNSREIHNTNYAMTVFATEGCASCHRLLGFESKIGLKVDNDREWFKKLFPEQIIGSQIVKAIEKNRLEIDQKIILRDKKDMILDEIMTSHPGAIEALYSNFKFAARAKDHEGEKISAPWKAEVHKVLIMFIETYGLGRVICPKLNWSGVVRSDQWLMEHFKSPTARIPRSIMPVFPFDDTKFYALTEMLNKLGQGNIIREREQWKKDGFNPEIAYIEHCSECHGDHLLGNGPVAEWIYPIPKNLKNTEFLRNLSKERAIESITNGVPGTPMPPWGVIGEGKSSENKTSVFTEDEIKLLVDWLYSGIPGETVIRSDSEVPKWNYKVEDVNQELKDEGNTLKDNLSFLQVPNQYLASLTPMTTPKEDPIFDEVPNTGVGPEKTAYFIKQKYYTPENIAAGQKFFIINCAACHGKEADGSSIRSEAMYEAKPRMLINMDWIQSHDDLRLLRSIKYGVAGTSMTPWGDFTSSLQRLQLVIFIRSLTTDKIEKREIENALYKAFGLTESDKQEREIYSNLGIGFLSLHPDSRLLNEFIQLIEKNKDDVARKKISENLEDMIDQHIKTISDKASTASWTKQKHNLISSIAEISRMKEQKSKK